MNTTTTTAVSEQIDEFYFKGCSGWFTTNKSIRSIHFIVYSREYGFPIGFEAPVSRRMYRKVRERVIKELEEKK